MIRIIVSRRMKWAAHVARIGKKTNAYRVSWASLEGKRPLERLRPRLEYNIKTDFTETGWSSMDWIHLAQDRDQWQPLENTIRSLPVPENVEKFLSN
jgi:hypothetical protein